MKKSLAILLVVCSLPLSAVWAQPAVPLTAHQVKRYIKTEIEVGRLQMRMKEDAAQYDSLIQTFYNRRKTLLKNRGWTEKEFEEVQSRIMEASSAIRNYKRRSLENRKQSKSSSGKDIDQSIANISSDDAIPADLKKKLIHKLKQAKVKMQAWENQPLDFKNNKWYNHTKKDWPAVRPYLKELTQLTDWYNGNGAEPPNIK